MTRYGKLIIIATVIIQTMTLFGESVSIHDGARIHPPKPSLPEGFLYWGTADSTLNTYHPDSDFGGSNQLQLDSSHRIIIQFEQLLPVLGGPFNTIDSARLVLHMADTNTQTPDLKNISVYRLRNRWNEGGTAGTNNYWAATWNSRFHSAGANRLAWTVPGASSPEDAVLVKEARVSYDSVSNTLDISGLEKSIDYFLNRQYENYGWLITGAGKAPMVFHSREATEPALRPALTLTVTPVDAPRHPIDLGVVYIERYPEYLSWKDANSYEQKEFNGMQVGIMKEPEFNDVPKNPKPGDMLEYVGVIKNHGPEPIQGFGYRWQVNDTTIKTGVYQQVLEPEKQAYVWLSHPAPENWNDHRDEWITLRVEPMEKKRGRKWEADKRAENKNNNELTIFTKARAAGIHADETARKFYRENYNAWGTYSFEDWIQFQLEYWNQIYFAKSRFSGMAPDGPFTRVRVQRVSWFRDGDLQGPVHVAFDWRDPRYDGMWGWDFGYVKPEDLKKPDCFFRLTLRMSEPSLIHEMSHQCFGLMDIYWMTMEPATNPETGEGGKVRLKDPRDPSRYLTTIGYWPKYGGLMGGGDTRYTPAHEATSLYSSHSVYALNANAPYRGGFFGDYLYGLPTNVTIHIIDENGKPVPDIAVQIYQSSYGVGNGIITDDKKVGTATSNSAGDLVLPTQPIMEDGPVTVATGHTLRPSPFGRIHVCGTNGNLLLQLARDNTYYYYMLPAWELNVAFAKGDKDSHTITWQLGPDSRIDTFKHVR